MNFRILKAAAYVALAITSIPAAFAVEPASSGWKNESQAGIVVTSGNTNTSSLSAGEAASGSRCSYSRR